MRYIAHRLRRLPDPAHKISRGIAAGVFTSFTPFFGFHFVIAAAIAWVMRGNMVAAVLSTFFGNPLTFPLIVTISMETGSHLLGRGTIPLPVVVSAFSEASLELWRNFTAIFTPAATEWGSLADFFSVVFTPYMVGSLIPGVATGVAAYILSRPLIAAYQKARVARLKKKFAKKREMVEAKRAEAEAKKRAE